MVSLLWFRRDLRLSDNAALHAAIERGHVVPVYIRDPEGEGAASRWWLHQSLKALEKALQQHGSRLIIRKGETVETLRTLASETGATAIFWNRLYESRIKEKLEPLGLELKSFPGHLLFEPWVLKSYRVFTPYWKACLELGVHGKPLPVPSHIPAPAHWPKSEPLDSLELEPKIDWASGFRETWTPGNPPHFDSTDYDKERDRPDHRGTSRLSPHLHFGEITPRQAWQHATEPFRRQLVWREFAHHLLYHFPHTATEPLRPEFARFPWQMNAKHFEAWTKGRTGYPLVDAGMRELWHTGWMHNRVRMVVASFLVKHLQISWQEGARWFWDTLVDADLANNTLGWQWSAGCGADAAPYFRIFNPTLQAGKFDPNGDYVRRWAPDSINIQPIVEHKAARERALKAFATLKS